MDLTFAFIEWFFFMLFFLSPLLTFFGASICIMGLVIGRLEKWTVAESAYFVCITATTVGYGDFRPKRRPSRFLSVFVALIGLVTTGIIVSAAVLAVQKSFEEKFSEGSSDPSIEAFYDSSGS